MALNKAEEIVNIATLRKLDELQTRTDLLSKEPDEDGRQWFDTNLSDPLLDEVVGLMCETFITEDGQPNYANISWFKEHSDYRVFPGEKDSFGWLTAGIQKGTGPILWFG